MSTDFKSKPGRPSMKIEDKKKCLNCMLRPSTIEELRRDVELGKAQTPNQRIAHIIEMYYRNKKKKEKQ